jgi:hypothetical protein
VRRLLVCLLAGITAVVLNGCSSRTGDVDRAEVLGSGDVRAVGSVLDLDGVPVHTPAGILDLAVSEVGERYDDDTPELDVDDLAAGPGSTLVEVAWELEFVAAYPLEVKGILDARTNRDYLDSWDTGLVELAVTAGDERIELPTPELGGRVVVAVPADAAPSVEVGYDGLVQTLSIDGHGLDEGRARELRPLAVQPGSGRTYGDVDWLDGPSCRAGTARVDRGLDATASCHTSLAVVTPYVVGRGWAPDGQSFVVVDLDTTVREPYWVEGDQSAAYDVTSEAWAATLGGAEPVATSRSEYGGRRLVFLADAAQAQHPRLRVTADLQVARTRGSIGPATTSYHLDETLRLVTFPSV